MNCTTVQSCRQDIFNALQACRSRTLELLAGIEGETFCQQAHPDFSPVGWHLGHIALTESYWILESCAGLPPLFPHYRRLFAADGLPKSERQNLPPMEVIANCLQAVRHQTLAYLETAPLPEQERLWRWLVQHESQHGETISFLLQILGWNQDSTHTQLQFPALAPSLPPLDFSLDEMVEIPGGAFEMGSERIEAQDNERPCHRIYLDTYWIDPYPVTCAQYREFMAAGGYQQRDWWSEAGWQWLQENPVSRPLYWVDSSDWDSHPVCGVSGYEAEAYGNFAGKRLPTEAEWEKAASWNPRSGRKQPYPWGGAGPNPRLSNYDTLVGHTTPVNAYPAGQSPYGCYDMSGNVWEWTASWFAGYEGFDPYPYPGYSQVYFDGQHRVLRGGSWATRPWGLRPSFRNWYPPGVRQVLAGFRCARGGEEVR